MKTKCLNSGGFQNGHNGSDRTLESFIGVLLTLFQTEATVLDSCWRWWCHTTCTTQLPKTSHTA